MTSSSAPYRDSRIEPAQKHTEDFFRDHTTLVFLVLYTVTAIFVLLGISLIWLAS